MKKLKISLLALVFTVGIGGAVVQKIQAASHSSTAANLFWYPVDPTTNETSGPEFLNGTKAAAETASGCPDQALPICAYGSTNSSLPTGTPVGSPPAADRILHDN